MAGGGAAISSVTFSPLKTIFTVNPSEYEDAGSITISCSGTPDSAVDVNSISSSDTSIAEATLDHLSRTVSGNNVTVDFMVKPNSAGTVTLTATAFDNVNLRDVTGTLEITVTAGAVDDEEYLNKRGLTHFWENIDTLKQDKLTAGAGILITNDVISATGGGTADAVDWGHITGSMSNQTDLMTALNAKANSADLATVATSGDYDDLTDKPTIGNATLTIQKNGTSAGTFTANATSNKTINITVPTTAADVSALPASTKYGASIAVSINTTDYKVTTTLKDQDGNTLGTAQVIDLPLESVVVNGSYDSTNKKIVLTLQSGSTIDIPVADLVAGLQSEITSTNKLSSDLVDDTNHTHKFVTAAQITKLNGIAAGAEVNVQSDWDQTTTTADDYIKNKPQLATVATSGAYSDLSGTPSLATVATSGSYNDLSNKPTIPAAQVNSDWNASSGVAQILNKPTIPEIKYTTTGSNRTSIASLILAGNNSSSTPYGYPTFSDGYEQQWSYIRADSFTSSISAAYIGAYIYDSTESWWSGKKEARLALYSDLSGKANTADLATVATSGSYNDLSNKPTIPTVNNATLTVTQNGTSKGTFTANQSTNATIALTDTTYSAGTGINIDANNVISATAVANTFASYSNGTLYITNNAQNADTESY